MHAGVVKASTEWDIYMPLFHFVFLSYLICISKLHLLRFSSYESRHRSVVVSSDFSATVRTTAFFHGLTMVVIWTICWEKQKQKKTEFKSLTNTHVNIESVELTSLTYNTIAPVP